MAALVALIAAILLLYGSIGHGLNSGPHGDGGVVEHSVVGLCLLVATALASLLALAPPNEVRLAAPTPGSRLSGLPIPQRPERSARASPAWLQRFLN